METKHLLYILISLIVIVLILIGIDLIRLSGISSDACMSDPIGYIKNTTGVFCSCLG